jgi:hypothetical protein
MARMIFRLIFRLIARLVRLIVRLIVRLQLISWHPRSGACVRLVRLSLLQIVGGAGA